FIDLLLAEWAPDDERKQFLDGLADVDARARAVSAADFVGASEAQRVAILTALDAEAQEARKAKAEGKPHFFDGMKSVTVYGYCTSEAGATAELHYEAIPGAFDPCAPMDRWRAAPADFCCPPPASTPSSSAPGSPAGGRPRNCASADSRRWCSTPADRSTPPEITSSTCRPGR